MTRWTTTSEWIQVYQGPGQGVDVRRRRGVTGFQVFAVMPDGTTVTYPIVWTFR